MCFLADCIKQYAKMASSWQLLSLIDLSLDIYITFLVSDLYINKPETKSNHIFRHMDSGQAGPVDQAYWKCHLCVQVQRGYYSLQIHPLVQGAGISNILCIKCFKNVLWRQVGIQMREPRKNIETVQVAFKVQSNPGQKRPLKIWCVSHFKGTVSRKLSPMLLYIVGKLSL